MKKEDKKVAIFNAECLEKTLHEILKGRTRFDRDYSILNFGYENEKGEVISLRVKSIITSDTYANVELLFENIKENDVKDLILREQYNKNLEKLNKFVRDNTEEIKFKDGKIIEHRK